MEFCVLLNKEEISKEAELVGLFSSQVSEEDPWLASPTLKVNADLGNFEDSFLHALALAEKARFEKGYFKSYTLDTRGKGRRVFSKAGGPPGFCGDLRRYF